MEQNEVVETKDISLETLLLSFLLRKNNIVLDKCDISFFTITVYRIIFDFVKKHRTIFEDAKSFYTIIKKEIPTELKSEIDNSVLKTYIKKIYKQNLRKTKKKNILVIIDSLKELSKSRIILKNISDIYDNLAENKIKKAEKIWINVLSDYEQKFTSKNKVIDYVKVKPRLKKIIERKKQILETGKDSYCVKTGLNILDNLLAGGFIKGEFGIVLGETNVGKSILLDNLACNAWLDKNNVILLSLEMDEEQVAYRIDSRLARIEFAKFRSAEIKLSEMKMWVSKIKKLRREMKNKFIIAKMLGNPTIDEVRRVIEQQQRKYDIEFDEIVLDYLQIASPSSYKHQGFEAMKSISWDIKNLAEEPNNKKVVLTGGQITDDYIGKSELTSKAAKYGRVISETFPIIFGMSMSQDDILDNTITLDIIKSRGSKKQKQIKLHRNFDLMLLYDEVEELNIFS